MHDLFRHVSNFDIDEVGHKEHGESGSERGTPRTEGGQKESDDDSHNKI